LVSMGCAARLARWVVKCYRLVGTMAGRM